MIRLKSNSQCIRIFRTGAFSALAFLVAACAVDQSEKSSSWPEVSAQQQNRLTQHESEQLEADQAFARQQYRRARDHYLILARRGDKFAQYRIALMHAEGLGVDRDLAVAHAWATLAAQLGEPPLVEFRDRLAGQLDPDTKARAIEHLLELEPQYGLISTSKRQNSKLVRKFRSCTGSRLGSTCANLQTVGSLKDADGNRYTSSFGFWRAAREQIAEFYEFMETEPSGQVTLRELELLDDDASDDSNQPDPGTSGDSDGDREIDYPH